MSYKRRRSDLKVRKKNPILLLGLQKTRNCTQNTQSSGSLLSPSQKVSQAGIYSGIMAGVTFSLDYLHMHQKVRKKRSTQSSSDTGKTTVCWMLWGNKKYLYPKFDSLDQVRDWKSHYHVYNGIYFTCIYLWLVSSTKLSVDQQYSG
jgi:hypothetical protein